MPRYKVSVEVTDVWRIWIDAANPNEAEEFVELLYKNDQMGEHGDIRETHHEIFGFDEVPPEVVQP